MSMTSSYIRSSLSYIRRHAGKIAFITLAATGTVAAVTYMRKQVSDMNRSIEAERTQGARRLRLVFMKNNSMICSAFRVLLPKIGDILESCGAVNVQTQLERLREKPQDKSEKQKLWEHVKESSITHFISAVYIVSLLYSLLSLQMNLLARYAHVNIDAPVQPLPSGALQQHTSKKFLELTRKNLLHSKHLVQLLTNIKSVVQSHVCRMKLTRLTSLSDVQSMFIDILNDLIPDKSTPIEQAGTGFDSTEDLISEEFGDDLWNWVMRDEELTNTENQEERDFDYEMLVEEAIDLSEVLDFGSVVVNNSFITLSHALECLRRDLESSNKKNPLPFARLFAHFSDIGSKLLSGSISNINDDQTSDADDETSELETKLSEDLQVSRFAACVFLSGEKENKRRHENTHRESETPERMPTPSPFVSNASHPVHDEPSQDLGLMFDIREADS